jgi:hypothetical protein
MGCVELNSLIEQHSFWVTSWGHHFFVPEMTDDGECLESEWHKVLKGIERTRPPTH